MVTTIIGIVGLWCAALSAAPDYISGRDAAAKLGTEEALAAFLQLADGPFSVAQKSDAWEQASARALALNRYDQAMALAKKIPTAGISKATQMRVLAARRDWAGLVAQFKDEDIDAWWPDHLNGEAFFCRGRAFAVTRDGPRAVADLRKAADALPHDDNSKGLALIALGDAYRDLLKDDGRAIVAYRETYGTANITKRCAAAMGAAGILVRQNKLAEAWTELNTIDLARLQTPYWLGAMLAARGSVLAKQGKTDEAIASYQVALRLEGLPASQKAACEKALNELRATPSSSPRPPSGRGAGREDS